MRLGKFLKFILISAYKKTIEKVDLNGFVIPIPERSKEESDSIYYEYLFKAEVLHLYFKVERSRKQANNKYRVMYKDTPEYRKALVQYTRAIYKLYEYGLIEIWESGYTDDWQSAIKLTEAGKEKALDLIGKS